MIIVVLIAIFWRFWSFETRWILNQDQARDAITALYGLKNNAWPEVGPASSAGPFNFGPWYYWITMFWEKVIPTVNGGWVGFGILGVTSVIFYYLGGGLIVGIMAAMAVGMVGNSPDMINTALVGFGAALTWWASKKLIDSGNWRWGVLLGLAAGLSINFHFQALGLLGIPLAIILINKFNLKKKLWWGIVMGMGLVLSFLPLIVFDLKNKGVWILSVIEYYTVGINKFYTPVRWLTEIRDFWPQLFGMVTVGINNFGYVWLLLGIVLLIIKNSKLRATNYEIKTDRFSIILIVTLLIDILLMRNYKGTRSGEYMIAFQGIIVLICGQITKEYFKMNKVIGLFILSTFVVLAGAKNWQNIEQHPSQAKLILEIKNEIDKKIKGQVTIEQYQQSDMVSLPLLYLYYRENRLDSVGTKLSFCDGNRYQCPSRETIKKNKYFIYINNGESWDKMSPENVYGRLMINYGKKQESTRFVTIVNPVRSRELWKDKSLKPIVSQYQSIKKFDLRATWLIQNDVLVDKELINTLKNFEGNQEMGIFLEVSKKLAYQSRVYFNEHKSWYDPGVIFLSGYSLLDRQKIIDKMMNNFKNTFGYFPKVAGAWWIDSYSQQYLENKYNIKTVLICADQKTTDKYGIWGQWWGYPYIPSADNILVPGESKSVVIQWAQRDLSEAYSGQGWAVSNHSLQANDYTSLGLDIKYFEKLAGQYLNVDRLGQITVGLETGMESVGHEAEYENQLKWIYDNKIVSLKMSEFGDEYRETFNNGNPEKVELGDWTMTRKERINQTLHEKTEYKEDMVFADSYQKDTSGFLNRIYKPENLIKKRLVDGDLLVRILLLIIGLIIIVKWKKKGIVLILSICLIVFGVTQARYTVINGEKMVGILVDNFRFVGINLKHGIINKDLDNLTAQSMLRLKLWK